MSEFNDVRATLMLVERIAAGDPTIRNAGYDEVISKITAEDRVRIATKYKEFQALTRDFLKTKMMEKIEKEINSERKKLLSDCTSVQSTLSIESDDIIDVFDLCREGSHQVKKEYLNRRLPDEKPVALESWADMVDETGPEEDFPSLTSVVCKKVQKKEQKKGQSVHPRGFQNGRASWGDLNEQASWGDLNEQASHDEYIPKENQHEDKEGTTTGEHLFFHVDLGYKKEWFTSATNEDGSPIGWRTDANGWFTSTREPIFRHRPRVPGKYDNRTEGWYHQAKKNGKWVPVDYSEFAEMFKMSIKKKQAMRMKAQSNGMARY
jgi:hypothetical protein